MPRPDLAAHRFKKGRSGNPGGRAKDFLGLRSLARSHAPDAIETLVKIMSGNYAAAARVQAAAAILDRGYGKPQQHVDAELRVEAVRVLAGSEFDTKVIEAVAKLGRKPDGAPLVLEAPQTRRDLEPDTSEGDFDDAQPRADSFREIMAELKQDLASVRTVKAHDRLEGFRDRDEPPLEPP